MSDSKDDEEKIRKIFKKSFHANPLYVNIMYYSCHIYIYTINSAVWEKIISSNKNLVTTLVIEEGHVWKHKPCDRSGAMATYKS